MELTREEIEKLASGDLSYEDICKTYPCTIPIRKIAQTLLAELDKPKLWDSAPDWAQVAIVDYYTAQEQKIGEPIMSHGKYTRELPKSRARQIAEEESRKCIARPSFSYEELADWIENGILKYAEENKDR